MPVLDGEKAKRRVIVIDDQEINRELLGMILEDDYDVLYAENGEVGLHFIRENINTLSLVLLDLVMPVMDGFTVLETMRADPSLHRIPIVVLTAEKSAELKSLKLGAADFITKPFDAPEVIRARVARIIELSEGRSLIRAAERDELTGLFNEHFFYEYCQRLERYNPNWEMDAVVVDIRRFNLVNEVHGREFGNKVLQQLAASIKRSIEHEGGIACRLEADIFFLFCRRREDYNPLLETLTEDVNRKVDNAHVRLRMGVCILGGREVAPERRFARAKLACNRLRGKYSKGINIYDQEFHDKEMHYESFLNDFQRALEEKQFLVFYQPKYNIEGDKPVLTSAEALVRWRHPECGMVSPGEFIPLFESNGLIQLVDYYVWRESAAQIRRWREELGITIPVSINLSRVDMYDPELENKLLDLLRENDLKPEELLLEITESAYTDDARTIIKVVESLRKHGFKIEMDDFGSGYSSLNMLSTLPIDVLKMDMKFIQNVREGSKNFRMVELVLDIAEYLGVPVVAEGVETEEQVRLLKNAGCSIIQGYYFSKPVDAKTFEKFLLEKKEALK